MKDYRRILAVVLTVILSVCLFVLPAMAATETANGLELTLITDKAEYTAAEQITASLTIKNTTAAPVTGLVIKHQIPEGVKTLSGDVEKIIPSLGAGESVTLQVVLQADATANTGDYAIAAVAAALVLSAAGLVLLGKDAKVRKGVISVFLCCVMVGGLMMAAPANADTDELTVTTAIKVAGKDVTLTASAKQMAEGTYSVVNIADMTNGAVTADKPIYTPGETVTLTIKPDSGYFQKLYIDGEPLKLDWKSKTYSFVAEKTSYEITGSFEQSLEMYAGDWGRWDNTNHAHGLLSAYYPNNNDAWWMKIKGEYASFSVNAKNYFAVEDSYDGSANGCWRFAIYMQLDNGKYYAFSIWNNENKQYAYNHFGGNIDGVASATGWGGAWCLLSDKNAQATAALNGDGAEFKIARIDGNHLQLTLGGTVLETYTIPEVTAANKVVSVGILHYGNKGERIDIPYELTVPGQEPPVDENAVNIQLPALEHGSVTTDKSSYQIGDTVTLTVSPDSGYFQKLYIDGQPLLLDWRSKTYSFVADKASYVITGSFERSLEMYAGDWGRWDNTNHAHGLLSAYYPNNNDAWWIKIKGEYNSFSVNAKNYFAVEDSYDGSANGCWRFAIYMQLDNGKYYAFSIWNNENKQYAYNHFGGNIDGVASATGWGGAWCLLSDKNAQATAALNGDGAEFKIARIDGNHLQLTLGGTVLETYTIPEVTEANKVISVGILHYANKGEYIDIPFELG